MNRCDKAVYYAQKQVEHCGPYVWGGQGEKLSKLTAQKLAGMETSAENAARVERFIYNNRKRFDSQTKIYDCSGLVCCALIYAGILKSGSDYTAQGLYNTFKTVNINSRKPGDLIFKGTGTANITHVGIVKDLVTVIEAKGRDYGCIESTIDGSWIYAARPEY